MSLSPQYRVHSIVDHCLQDIDCPTYSIDRCVRSTKYVPIRLMIDQQRKCYFIWYDKHKGRKIMPAITVNRIDGVDWKRLRLFYSAALRDCAKFWRQNRDWDRAWLVNGRQFFPSGDWKFCIVCVFCAHQEQHKQHLWWHRLLGNMARMKISLERNWFMLYFPRNLKQTFWGLVYQSGPP